MNYLIPKFKAIFFEKVVVLLVLAVFSIFTVNYASGIFSYSVFYTQLTLLILSVVSYGFIFLSDAQKPRGIYILVLCGVEVLLLTLFSFYSELQINMLVMILSLNLLIAGLTLSFVESFFVLSASILSITAVVFFREVVFLKYSNIYFLLNILSFIFYFSIARYIKTLLQKGEIKIDSLIEQLFGQEQLNRVVLEAMNAGLFFLDSRNSVIKKNNLAKEIFNKKPDEVSYFLKGSKLFQELETEEKIYSLRKYLVPNNESYNQVVLLLDETEQISIQKELEKEKKMAAVGKLSAGIAHEIRNPLAGISGSIELLKEGGLDGSTSHKLFNSILKEINRLNGLITDFLNFASPGVKRDTQVDLQTLLTNVVELLQKDSRYKGIELSLECESFLIKADENKLKQVFLNIILNALQAFDEKRLEKLKQDKRPPQVKIRGVFTDYGFEVAVKDNGVGIEKHKLDSIFEPFHTTKDRGTGLGLAIVHRILEGHDALPKVTSLQGQGTEFFILFKK